MDNRYLAVKVEDSFNYLSENAASGQLSHLSIWELFDIFSQTYAFDVVGHEIYLLLAVNQIVQIDNTWMI